MRRLLSGVVFAGLLAASVAGPVAAKPAATYDVVMTVDGCDFTFLASWTRARVEQTAATFRLPVGYQGITYGAGSHNSRGAFKNYGNNQVIRIHQFESTVEQTFRFAVYFWDAEGTVLNIWESDEVTLFCE